MGSQVTFDFTILDQIVADDAGRDAWLRGVGNDMVSNMVVSMQQSPASGQTYQRGRRTHTASSPGNPPRIDFGTLAGSIKLIRLALMRYSLQTDELHGHETEFGIGMQPRPWMRPEVLRMNKELPERAKGQLP